MVSKLKVFIFHHNKECGCVIKKVLTQEVHWCNLKTKSLSLSVISSISRFYLKVEKLRKKQYFLRYCPSVHCSQTEVFLSVVSCWDWMVFLDARKSKLHNVACVLYISFALCISVGGGGGKVIFVFKQVR